MTVLANGEGEAYSIEELSILSKEVLLILYQLIEPAEIVSLGENALEMISQKRMLLHSITEALHKVHGVIINDGH